MGGVEVAVTGDRLFAPPAEIALTVELDIADIVLVARLAVEHLAEQFMLHHIQHHHDIAEIADILQHHEGHAGGFGGLHQFPGFFERGAAGHLDAGVLSRAHGCQRHGGVPFPGSGRDDRIEIGAFRQPLEVPLSPRISFREGVSRIGDHVLAAEQVVGIDVTQSGDYHPRQGEQNFEECAAAIADADHADADRLRGLPHSGSCAGQRRSHRRGLHEVTPCEHGHGDHLPFGNPVVINANRYIVGAHSGALSGWYSNHPPPRLYRIPLAARREGD